MEGWYNQASPVSLNVLLNLIDTALLRAYSNSSKGRFTTSVSFHSGGATTPDVKQKEEVPPVYLKLSEALIKINRNNNTWNGITTGIMFVTLGYVVQYHIEEKVSGVRELQLMTGLSGPLYVATHFLFDLLIQFLAPLGVCFAIYSIRYADLTADRIVFLYMLLLAVAPMAILESYMLVQLVQSEAASELSFTVLFFVGDTIWRCRHRVVEGRCRSSIIAITAAYSTQLYRTDSWNASGSFVIRQLQQTPPIVQQGLPKSQRMFGAA